MWFRNPTVLSTSEVERYIANPLRARRPVRKGMSAAILFAAAATFVACDESTTQPATSTGSAQLPSAPQQPATKAESSETACASHVSERQAFFGDVHVHTAYSMDAYTSGVRATPEDAYRFARGERMPLTGGRTARLERPLDFAAVSDHAEYLGEVSLCKTPGSFSYDHPRCAIYRGEDPKVPRGARMGVLLDQVGPFVKIAPFPKLGRPVRAEEMCGEDLEHCKASARSIWAESQVATERMHDASPACSFTTLHAYEYTWTPELSKIHRNIIFRNAVVPDLPITSVETGSTHELWQRLDAECIAAGTGCDVLSIPHNPNLSNGRMFNIEYRDQPLEVQREWAALQARIEPLVEVMQVKGDSECRNGMSEIFGGRDEYCEFEKFRPAATEDCGDGTSYGALGGQGCVSRHDFVRYALLEGLREQRRIGVNPLKLGFSASTDSHNGTPGDTEEYSYDGAHAESEGTAAVRLSAPEGAIVDPTAANPGGLFGVWAEENSRDSLFDAMRRKETFGTSGTRIQPRFFAGWNFEASACAGTNPTQVGYNQGVAMGGDLPRRDEASSTDGTGGAPSILAFASADPGTDSHPGGRLERIQVIKAWIDDSGRRHQAVHDLAVAAETSGAVDFDTCAPAPGGASELCGVWRDPDFDPDQPTVYYTRVLERPSCRWTAWTCKDLPPDGRPAACDGQDRPMQIRERAWTSPIWYTPKETPNT